MAFNIKELLENTKKPSLSLREKEDLWRAIEMRITGVPASSPFFSIASFFTRFAEAEGSKLVVVGALALVLVVGSSGTLVAFADSSIPGDSLFPVKRAVEEIRLSLAQGDKKDDLRVAFAKERVEEVKLAIATKSTLAHASAGTTAGTSTPPATTTPPFPWNDPRAEAAIDTAIDHLADTRARLAARGNLAALSVLDALIAELESLPNATTTGIVAKVESKIKGGDSKLKLTIVGVDENGEKGKTKIEVKTGEDDVKIEQKNKWSDLSLKLKIKEAFDHEEKNKDDEDNDDEDEDDDRDDHKVTICHKSGKKFRTIEVDERSLKGHLRHGDKEGSCEGGNGTPTTTPDTIAPSITNLSASNIGSTTAQVSWSTSEAATGKLYFATSTPPPLSTFLTSGTATTSHALSLSSLSASTTYHFFVTATDGAGNTATSSTSFFTTVP